MKRVEQLIQCNHPGWFAILQKSQPADNLKFDRTPSIAI